ncbi:unnamed protein product [Kluyveromyces dobzhanskii CBS 2104]|uniref:Aminopeptidase n=1 Tax=Kluyveromyces dobzhanskii CBS 2104 TaxID=1427455 RepID=A0A0A8L8G6_9SACH|nr:unnamed protein product [Kluyveromyces dobzhanskii CBS 2104]
MVLSLTEPVVPIEYNLDLQVDHKSPNFKGQLIVQLQQRIPDKPFETFKLHSSKLIVTNASLDDKPLSIRYDAKEQIVSFTSSVPLEITGSTAELRLSYIGKVNTIKTHREPTTGLIKTNFMSDATGISDSFLLATHTQPVFARTIFPCFDEPNSKCKYQLTLTTDAKFKVVSNTCIESHSLTDLGKQIVKFGKTPLMNTSYFGFCIGDLEFMKTNVQLKNKTIPLQLLAPQSISHAAYSFDTIAELLPVIEKRLGADYPLEKLDVVLLPFLSDMAMENWGLLTFQMNHLLLPPHALSDGSVIQQVRQLIVHELCHQWMGNYISFDSWDHLWFNEAFATWFACDLLDEYDNDNYWSSDNYLTQMENVIAADIELSVKSISQSSIIDAASLHSTSDAFEPHIYNKGISILRSLQQSVGKNNFDNALAQIFGEPSTFHEKCIKPIDIFNRMGELLKSENIANFFSSWTRTPGIPIVSVITDDDKTTLEQHRLLSEKTDVEDVPYHIPLFALQASGDEDAKNGLLTDRTLKLSQTELILNTGTRGLYRVSYETPKCYKLICAALKDHKIQDVDLLKLFIDLKFLIGSDYQKKIHIDGIISVLKFISSETEMTEDVFRGLSIGLDILQTIETAQRTYSGKSDKTFITEIYAPLWSKLSWSDLSKSPFQLKVMSKVMFGIKHLDSTLAVANQLMKNIFSGPNSAVPLELCGSVFATISYHQKNVKQWKKLYELVKSAKGVDSHVEGGTYLDIQNLALENLGFNTNEELIKKTLNFILTNIASTSVENALFGLNYNFREPLNGKGSKLVRDVCWEWFELNYDIWARKSLREGAESSENMKKTLMHISYVIFQMWMDNTEKIDQFVTKKSATYGKAIGTAQIWNSVKGSEKSKMNIYKGILGF